MGDRTTVNLTVRKEDLLKNQSLFADADDKDEQGNSLMSLTYYDINYANLDFESILQEKRIPYDKSWDNGHEYPCGTEYCRVLSDGNVEVKEFSGFDEDTINLDETIKAYKQGDIVTFLESKKNELAVMSWDDQEIIMQGRSSTEEALLSIEQEPLDSLVVEMSCELSPKLNQTDDEDAQEEAIVLAEHHAVEINNQGKEEQVNYLLNNGYLSQGIIQHFIPSYRLFNESDDLWLRDDIQFPRLIAEISANFSLNGEEYIDLKESMDLDDKAVNELFDRANNAWEVFKGNTSINNSPKRIPFALKDECMTKEYEISGYIDNSLSLGVALNFSGYSDHCSNDDNGTPIYIQKYDGKLQAIIYADINQEDPTHVISLEGAKNSKRITEE